MGPHSGECGNCDGRWGTRRGYRYFNGAALWRVRKYVDTRAPQPSTPYFNGAALWRVRKFGHHSQSRCDAIALQWGRTLESAEIGREEFIAAIVDKLQWGRTLESAEIKRNSSA